MFEMEHNLNKKAFANDSKRELELVRALEMISKAAASFEQRGMIKEAESLTTMLEVLSSNPDMNNLDEERMKNNLKAFGSPFVKEHIGKSDEDNIFIGENIEDAEDDLLQHYLDIENKKINDEVLTDSEIGEYKDNLYTYLKDKYMKKSKDELKEIYEEAKDMLLTKKKEEDKLFYRSVMMAVRDVVKYKKEHPIKAMFI